MKLPDPRKVRPPHYLEALLVVAALLQFICKPARVVYAKELGAALLIAGFLFMVNAKGLFDRRKTPVRHNQTPSALVTDGPFRFTRNPMYLGIEVLLTGIGLFAGTWPFLAVPVVMFCILNFGFIPWEEKLMSELFKDQYTAYCRQTRRWL